MQTRSRAACFQLAEGLLRDLQNTVAKLKSSMLHLLLQRPAWPPENSQPTLFPYPGIANPGRERGKLLKIADLRFQIVRFPLASSSITFKIISADHTHNLQSEICNLQ